MLMFLRELCMKFGQAPELSKATQLRISEVHGRSPRPACHPLTLTITTSANYCTVINQPHPPTQTICHNASSRTHRLHCDRQVDRLYHPLPAALQSPTHRCRRVGEKGGRTRNIRLQQDCRTLCILHPRPPPRR